MTVVLFILLIGISTSGVFVQGGPAVVTSTDGGTFDVLHSPNQLQKTSLIEVLIIPGSELDNPSTTNINNRYECGDYEFEFEADPDDPLSVLLTVKATGMNYEDDEPGCEVDWGDGDTGSIKIEGASTDSGHTYLEYGVFDVTFACSDKKNGAVSCPNRDTSCVTTSPFFDDVFKSVTTPLRFFITDALVLKSFMELDLTCGPQAPSIIWRLSRIVTNETTDVNFTQPVNSVLRFDPEVLEAGDYLVFLEVAHTHKGSQYWVEDYMFINMAVPELIPIIEGGHVRHVSHGETLYANASKSLDPVTRLESITNETLVKEWSFSYYASAPSGLAMASFITGFPISGTPPTLPVPSNRVITPGTEDVLEIDTSMFALNSWALVMFTMSRGDRNSSTMQILKFISNAVPVSIQCVYNCNPGRERKFNYDRIELDSVFPVGFDTSALTFAWTLYSYELFLWFPNVITTTTGLNTQSVDILASSLVQGKTYKIVLTVSGGGYAATNVELYGTINYLPYGGTCTMNTLTGEAARTWFVFKCSGWSGVDDRRTKQPLLSNDDANPMLTINVIQFTSGALVEEEPILKTRSQQSHLILKLGDPGNAYETTLKVRVTDFYRNYVEIPLTVTANPAFAWDEVTPDANGSAIITSYTTVDYAYDEKQLVDMGKVDLIISLVSSVCSHIHLINIPQWSPPVPRVLNDGGSILDLNQGGNTEVESFDTVVEDASTVLYDEATLALMDVMQQMMSVIRNSVELYIINGTRGNDKFLGSILTNAFTNLAARHEYVNFETKVDMVFVSEFVGTASLDFKENATVDESAQIEVSTGEVYYMSQAIVNNIVPNNLRQFRQVSDLKSGRTQVGDMLSVVGQNISTYDTNMSPEERAQLYITMQYKLLSDLDYRKQTAKDAAKLALNIFKNSQDKLRICAVCTNQGSDKTDQLVVKNLADNVTKSTYNTSKSTFRLDGLESIVGNESATARASVSAVEFTENVFMYDDDQKSSLVTSNVLHIDVKASEARVTPGYMTFDQTVITPNATLTQPLIDEEDASEFSLHKFIYQTNTDNVCVIVRPEDETRVTFYSIFIRYDAAPTILKYNVKVTVTKDTDWKVCIGAESMGGHTGIAYMAVQTPGDIKYMNYYFTLVTLGCLTWEEGVNKWHSDKCDMEWKPQEDKISCYCRNLTDLTFANTFFVAPNTIDFSSVFLKFSPLNQAAVMGTLGSLFVFYVIAVLFLIGLDRKDVVKWGVTPLRDNLFGDDNFYIIKVYTGLRRGAGTTSRVAFVLSGDRCDTGPREMFDGLRQDFSTGSIRSFFMATKKHLGTLFHLYIWHDNTGEEDGTSWYLNQVVVYDITKQTTYTFVAERWLSVETSVDAELQGTSPDKTVEFESRFFYQTRDRLSENHMWISVLYRPQTSTFTRVQRVSCALVYIMLTMIANAMYFNPESDYENAPLIKAGPFRFTLQQLYISMICALITTPPVMLLIFLFKRTKRKPVIDKSKDGEPDKKPGCCQCKCPCGPFCYSLFRTRKAELEKKYEEECKQIMLSAEVPEFKTSWQLHHRFIYAAWFLVVAGTVVPAFFIILYSMEWGKQKSEEWLTTLLMSLVESIVFVDPFMVLAISLVLACLIRKPTEEEHTDIGIIVENYKIQQGMGTPDSMKYSHHVLQSIRKDYDTFKTMPLYRTPPIKGTNLEEAAIEYQHQKKMASVMMDLCLSVFLMLIIFTICYSNRDDRSYRHREFLFNQLVDPNYNTRVTLSPRFYSIKTHGDMFEWINQTVFPSLFPETDINGSPLHWTVRQFMNGYYNLRLGPPRLRQLRTTKRICDIPRYGRVPCYGEYTFGTEDTRDFCIGWTDEPCPVTMTRANFSLPAWSHQSAFDIWGMPIPGITTTYGGGGYLATFAVNRNNSIDILDELFHGQWMDRQTRAVFFEFTLYCASTNLFIYNVFSVEFPETGGAFKTVTIYPIRVYTHSGAIGMIALLCEIIFVIYVIVLFVKICIRVYQQRCAFFKNFWQMYDLVIFTLSVTAIAVYFIRLGFTNLTVQNFHEDKKLFVNFSHIVLWDQVLIAVLAFLVFLATLRILEIFGNTKKVQAVVNVFRNCGKDLTSFTMTFFFLFMAFCILGHLLFGSTLHSYKNMYRTMGSLFILVFGVTKYGDITATQPVLAKVFFILYVMSVIFFVLTIFMSILGGGIDDAVKDSRNNQQSDVIEYMMTKFKSLIVKPDAKKGRDDDEAEKKKKKKRRKKKKSKEERPRSLNEGSIDEMA